MFLRHNNQLIMFLCCSASFVHRRASSFWNLSTKFVLISPKAAIRRKTARQHQAVPRTSQPRPRKRRPRLCFLNSWTITWTMFATIWPSTTWAHRSPKMCSSRFWALTRVRFCHVFLLVNMFLMFPNFNSSRHQKVVLAERFSILHAKGRTEAHTFASELNPPTDRHWRGWSVATTA